MTAVAAQGSRTVRPRPDVADRPDHAWGEFDHARLGRGDALSRRQRHVLRRLPRRPARHRRLHRVRDRAARRPERGRTRGGAPALHARGRRARDQAGGDGAGRIAPRARRPARARHLDQRLRHRAHAPRSRSTPSSRRASNVAPTALPPAGSTAPRRFARARSRVSDNGWRRAAPAGRTSRGSASTAIRSTTWRCSSRRPTRSRPILRRSSKPSRAIAAGASSRCSHDQEVHLQAARQARGRRARGTRQARRGAEGGARHRSRARRRARDQGRLDARRCRLRGLHRRRGARSLVGCAGTSTSRQTRPRAGQVAVPRFISAFASSTWSSGAAGRTAASRK